MNYQYDMNVDTFMICVAIKNSRRWLDIYEQLEIIKLWKGKVSSEVHDLMSYGLDLMINGREPEIVDFFITEYIQRLIEDKKIDAVLNKDLRLVKLAILWMHCGEGYRLVELLSSIKDPEIKANYQNWMYINQFDCSLDIDDYNQMSEAEIQKLIKSKEYIMEENMRSLI